MKKYKLRSLAVLLAFIFTLPIITKADDWGKADPGNFHAPQNISSGIQYNYPDGKYVQASIEYGGKILTFINYEGEYKKASGYDFGLWIYQYSFKNAGTPDYAVWENPVYYNYENLKAQDLQKSAKKHQMTFQPAPVVFNNDLYLFVLDKDSCVAYSIYNITTDRMTPLTKTKFTRRQAGYMSAVTLNGKLCLITSKAVGENQIPVIHWTEDLKNWTDTPVNFAISEKLEINSVLANSYISAIVKTSASVTNGVTKVTNRLMIGLIDQKYKAQISEYVFDNKNNLYHYSTNYVTENINCKSISLCQGSITQGGNTVQAFFQVYNMEDKSNKNGRRILRYEQTGENPGWYLAEKNMFPLSQWSDEGINLTSFKYAVNSGDTINQYMCLFYSNPSIRKNCCASRLTDHLMKDPNANEKSTILSDPANTLYIGYIEGPPPFYLNPKPPFIPNIYYSPEGPISEVTFESSSETGTEDNRESKYGISTSIKFGGIVNNSYSYAYETCTGKSTTLKSVISRATQLLASSDVKGSYLSIHPTVNRIRFLVCDVKNMPLYPTYYYYMGDPDWDVQTVEGLKNGLVPSNPESYDSDNTLLPIIRDYNSVVSGTTNISWNSGTGSNKVKLEASEKTKESNSTKNTFKIGAGIDIHKIFETEVEGESTVEIETTCETITTNAIEVVSRYNEAEQSGDLIKLSYKPYWILPTKGKKSWWFHEGQDTTQNTWCLTYRVSYGVYKGDITFPRGTNSSVTTSKQNDNQSSKDIGFALYQNTPNPFKPVTKIKYQIGNENSGGNTNAQGSQTRLTIYNTTGIAVAELVNEWKSPGSYEVDWDASKMPPGIYFYHLQSGNFKDIKKLILVK